jgi:hypothetical protein
MAEYATGPFGTYNRSVAARFLVSMNEYLDLMRLRVLELEEDTEFEILKRLQGMYENTSEKELEPRKICKCVGRAWVACELEPMIYRGEAFAKKPQEGEGADDQGARDGDVDNRGEAGDID